MPGAPITPGGGAPIPIIGIPGIPGIMGGIPIPGGTPARPAAMPGGCSQDAGSRLAREAQRWGRRGRPRRPPQLGDDAGGRCVGAALGGRRGRRCATHHSRHPGHHAAPRDHARLAHRLEVFDGLIDRLLRLLLHELQVVRLDVRLVLGPVVVLLPHGDAARHQVAVAVVAVVLRHARAARGLRGAARPATAARPAAAPLPAAAAFNAQLPALRLPHSSHLRSLQEVTVVARGK